MSEWPESLTDAQITELKASAITPAVAHKLGLYSIDDPKVASKLFGRTWRQWEGHLPVLVWSYRLPFQRDPVLVRGKPARPFETEQKNGQIALAKYVQATKTGTHIMFGPSLFDGPALRDAKIPILATEGEKKLAAAESAGFACIALPGTSQWHLKGEKELHPYFAHAELMAREFFLCFDADALANAQVRKDELAFGRAVQARGAAVYVVRFPPDAPKLDDFLATHEISEFYQLLDDARKRGKLPPDTGSKLATSEDWAALATRLRCDEDDAPIKDVDNIARILMLHPAWEGVLAYDARRERQTFVKAPPFADDITVAHGGIPRPLIDSDVSRIADWLVAQRCLGWTTQPQPSQLERAISIACERNRVDSVARYLKPLAWDQVPRLDTMGATYFGTEDTPYTRAVFRKWMLSAVARTRTPGCKVDHVLVLEGPQGLGKSTALFKLAGSEEHFSDALPDIATKDALEHCIGPWLIELAELDHMSKSEVSAMKAFISLRAPAFRHAYGRRTAEHPRRCVFAATTNETGYLKDPTGGRRFWPVECTKADSEGIERDRDQLWAEAVAAVRAGEKWHITDPDVQRAAEAAQAERRQLDPWQELIVPFLRGRKVVTIGQVLDHLGFGHDAESEAEEMKRRATERRSTFRYTDPDLEEARREDEKERAARAERDIHKRRSQTYDQRSANRVAAILREMGWIRRQLRVSKHERIWQYVLEDPGTRVTRQDASSGDRQVVDFKAKSPASPLSPVHSAGNAREQAGGISNSSSTTNSVDTLKRYSSDTGDSGDFVEIPGGCDVTTGSPVTDPGGDTVKGRKSW